MQEKQEVNCNCMSPFFNPTEKMFLLRKRDLEEGENAYGYRRTNKSVEKKNESEGKIQKKSLKKRPGSHIQGDIQLFQQQIHEIPRGDEDNRRMMAHDQHQVRHAHISYRPIDNLHLSYQPIQQPQIAPKPSQPLYRTKPSYSNYHRESQLPQNSISHFATALQQPPTPYFMNEIDAFPPPKIPILEFNSQQENAHHYTSRLNHAGNPSNQQEYSQQQQNKIQQLLTFRQTQQEANMRRPSFENSMMIQEFDRLLKNKEEIQSHTTLVPENKGQMRPRDIQKSRRFEKQQLVGRLAESDDDGCSDSAPSEVIGKGFDHSFKDFQDFDEGYHFSQTAATRSTNTKASQLHNKITMEHSQQHIKDKFGSINHFKSYRKL